MINSSTNTNKTNNYLSLSLYCPLVSGFFLLLWIHIETSTSTKSFKTQTYLFIYHCWGLKCMDDTAAINNPDFLEYAEEIYLKDFTFKKATCNINTKVVSCH
jgi:hypothetical protein